MGKVIRIVGEVCSANAPSYFIATLDADDVRLLLQRIQRSAYGKSLDDKLYATVYHDHNVAYYESLRDTDCFAPSRLDALPPQLLPEAYDPGECVEVEGSDVMATSTCIIWRSQVPDTCVDFETESLPVEFLEKLLSKF